jgi:hypothetical protein
LGDNPSTQEIMPPILRKREEKIELKRKIGRPFKGLVE